MPGHATGLPARGLALYWLVVYGAWLAFFYYYRYVTVLEFLAPVLTVALWQAVWPRRSVLMAPALAIVVFLTTSVGLWGRTSQWRPFWFNPRLPPLALVPDQLVFLTEPRTSFAAPFFPRSAVFVALSP